MASQQFPLVSQDWLIHIYSYRKEKQLVYSMAAALYLCRSHWVIIVSLQVQFQVGTSNVTEMPRAMNIISKRAILRGHVESIKDQVGEGYQRGDDHLYPIIILLVSVCICLSVVWVHILQRCWQFTECVFSHEFNGW